MSHMSRVNRVIDRMEELNLDGLFLVQNERVSKKNVRYLSGFTGTTAYLVITPEKRILTTDDRYTVQAAEECEPHGFEIVPHVRPFTGALKQIVAGQGIKRLGYETGAIMVSMFNEVKEALPGVELVPTEDIVEGLRAFKDEEEIAILAEAAAMTDCLFEHVLGYIEPGVSERDLALEFECFSRKMGASGLSFGLIVASGARGAMQHGAPTAKKIENGDFVVMDFGIVYKGYLTDVTRTVLVGTATPEQRRVYETVRQAQEEACCMIRPGLSGRDAARRAYDIMVEAGYGEYCSRNLGHGVGMEIHEEPFLTLEGDVVLQPGHLVTVEPGIYVPGWGGVRIEDMVLVQGDGSAECRLTGREDAPPRILTKATRELIQR